MPWARITFSGARIASAGDLAAQLAYPRDSGEESTLLYVLSHTAPHTNLHINKSTEA